MPNTTNKPQIELVYTEGNPKPKIVYHLNEKALKMTPEQKQSNFLHELMETSWREQNQSKVFGEHKLKDLDSQIKKDK